jgi:hypothetical protein
VKIFLLGFLSKSQFFSRFGRKTQFVTPWGLSKGLRSSLVHSEITAKDLFAEVDE